MALITDSIKIMVRNGLSNHKLCEQFILRGIYLNVSILMDPASQAAAGAFCQPKSLFYTINTPLMTSQPSSMPSGAPSSIPAQFVNIDRNESTDTLWGFLTIILLIAILRFNSVFTTLLTKRGECACHLYDILVVLGDEEEAILENIRHDDIMFFRRTQLGNTSQSAEWMMNSSPLLFEKRFEVQFYDQFDLLGESGLDGNEILATDKIIGDKIVTKEVYIHKATLQVGMIIRVKRLKELDERSSAKSCMENNASSRWEEVNSSWRGSSKYEMNSKFRDVSTKTKFTPRRLSALPEIEIDSTPSTPGKPNGLPKFSISSILARPRVLPLRDQSDMDCSDDYFTPRSENGFVSARLHLDLNDEGVSDSTSVTIRDEYVIDNDMIGRKGRKKLLNRLRIHPCDDDDDDVNGDGDRKRGVDDLDDYLSCEITQNSLYQIRGDLIRRNSDRSRSVRSQRRSPGLHVNTTRSSRNGSDDDGDELIRATIRRKNERTPRLSTASSRSSLTDLSARNKSKSSAASPTSFLSKISERVFSDVVKTTTMSAHRRSPGVLDSLTTSSPFGEKILISSDDIYQDSIPSKSSSYIGEMEGHRIGMVSSIKVRSYALTTELSFEANNQGDIPMEFSPDIIKVTPTILRSLNPRVNLAVRDRPQHVIEERYVSSEQSTKTISSQDLPLIQLL